MEAGSRGERILKVIEGVEVYAPEPLGTMDVLIAAGTIARMERGHLDLRGQDVEVVSGKGRTLVPGFIDGHVHILGGGGEGGYASRTPEIMFGDLAAAGVTTVIGCLGTDGTTRTMPSLLAKARGLEEEGITTYIYTGSYQVPVKTLTGSVRDDLILIDKVLGAGEIAISDHRSSQPTFEEMAKLAAEARVGGMLSGKAGVVNLHIGDGDRMLAMLERIIAETEIPAKHFIPTHINRSQRLLAAGCNYARQDGCRGRFIDLTTSSIQDGGSLRSGAALRALLEAGAPIDAISFSSDGQGSLPVFNKAGEYAGLGVGRVESLFGEVRHAIQAQGVPLEQAIRTITSTPASYLRLGTKGAVRVGADADLVMLDRVLAIEAVLAKGRFLVKDSLPQRFGTFETRDVEPVAHAGQKGLSS